MFKMSLKVVGSILLGIKIRIKRGIIISINRNDAIVIEYIINT